MKGEGLRDSQCQSTLASVAGSDEAIRPLQPGTRGWAVRGCALTQSGGGVSCEHENSMKGENGADVQAAG